MIRKFSDVETPTTKPSRVSITTDPKMGGKADDPEMMIQATWPCQTAGKVQKDGKEKREEEGKKRERTEGEFEV